MKFAIVNATNEEFPRVQDVTEGNDPQQALADWYAGPGGRVMRHPKIYAQPYESLTPELRESYEDRYGSPLGN
jgi:hypothetical protein